MRKLRAELGIGEDELVVGTVGRMVREKGYEELFDAARIVRSRIPNARFLAVGGSDLDKEDAITAEAIERVRDDVVFTGWREDIADLMALMDVFVLPSWREGLPRSAVEAAASGLPQVLTDIRGCREVVRDGVEGFLVPVRDPVRLADAIVRLLQDPVLRRRMGVVGADARRGPVRRTTGRAHRGRRDPAPPRHPTAARLHLERGTMTIEPIQEARRSPGAMAFPDGLPLARPRVADPARVAADVEAILRSGVLTNGPYVRRFEELTADYLGVRHCIAVSSCTAGLMLVLRAAELSGDVIVPSFTFAATAHAVQWNGLRPVFADIDRRTLTLSPDSVRRSVGMHTSAILATHIYGTPCDVEGLRAVAREHGLRLFFDAAHAFGSTRAGTRVGGFGDAEVFSLSPTKVVVAAEGGLIATNDDLLAERCRIGRDYGNPGDYDCRFVGLNARMSELHAATALASLEDLDERLAERNRLAAAYTAALAGTPGVRIPEVPAGDTSTYKDYSVLIDADEFGLDADAAAEMLAREGIETRRYYSPPVHAMKAYRVPGGAAGELPVTELAAEQALTLPLWVGMTDAQVEGVAEAIRGIRA